MKIIIIKLLYNIFIWSGGKLFDITDIYAPDDDVVAVTFSNNRKYIDRVSKIELKEKK